MDTSRGHDSNGASPAAAIRRERPRPGIGSHTVVGARALRARGQRRIAHLPAPLRGVWEALGPLLILALISAVPVAALGAFGLFGSLEQTGVAVLASLNFLFSQGAHVAYSLPAERGMTAATGVLTLTPLFGVLMLFALSAGAGRRMLAAARNGWETALSYVCFAGTIAGVDALVAWLATTAFAHAAVLQAALVPALWGLAGLLAGGLVEAGGVVAFLGRTSWLQAKGQWWRWGADYARALARAIGVVVLCLVTSAALGLAVAIGTHWAPVLSGYEAVSMSAAGSGAITLIHLGYLPNFVAFALAWFSGAGFSFGTNTVLSPLGTTSGALPPLPLLASVPMHVPAWAMAALLVPVLCGAIGAWWFVREGEDHVGEWVQLRMGPGAAAVLVGHFINSLALGLAGGLFGALTAWVSSGSLGLGRFTQIGADPLQVLWMLGLEVFMGSLLGFLVVPWLEFD